MTVSGLENNYYLSGNDIYIKLQGFAAQPQRIEVFVINNTTGEALPPLKLYSPSLIYSCNISLAVRALQPEPNHLNINTMSLYSFVFTAYFEGTDVTEVAEVENRYFIRGGVNKAGSAEWFMPAGSELLVCKWITWQGVDLPSLPHRIQGAYLVEYIPQFSQYFVMPMRGMCSPTIIKFLNSKGSYQYYIFEFAERKLKTKGKGQVARASYSLRGDRSRSIGKTDEEMLILKSKTPEAVQDVYMDMIRSNDILLFDPAGNDDLSRWHRLELDQTNDAVLNNRDRNYDNEAVFRLPQYVNRDL